MLPRLLGMILAGLLAVLAGRPVSVGADPAPADKNLVVNGDFEDGKDDQPTGWQRIDGLTTFWVKDADPKHGRVLKVDTDVLQKQGYDWWVEIARGASPGKAPKKLPTVEPKYDTLAGLDGVWIWSDPFPIEKGKSYWLSLDVKGPEIMLWLVGYPEKPDTAFGADAGAFQEYLKAKLSGKEPPQGRDRELFVNKYVYRGQLKAGGSNDWKTYSRTSKPFRPTSATPKVRWGRILLLPYWPPAEYYIDNVKLIEVKDE